MSGLVLGIHIVVSFFIIIVVLLQVGRGAELGAAFGSMGQANSSRGAATFLGKFTAAIAVTFMVTSFILTFQTSSNAKKSVLESISADDINRAPISEEIKPAEKIDVDPSALETPIAPITAEKEIATDESVGNSEKSQKGNINNVSTELPAESKEETAK